AHAAEEVLDRLPRRQRHRETTDAEARDEAGHVEPEVLQRRDERDLRDEDLELAPAEWDRRHRPKVPMLVEPPLEARHEDVEPAQDEPRDRDDRERLLRAGEEALDRHREREEAKARGEDRETDRETQRAARLLGEPPVEGG